MREFDVVVIGGGISGVAIGYELADTRHVCLLEADADLAHQTTGRSAATFVESFGKGPIRRLTSASRAFYEDPPEEFDRPLLTPGPKLVVGGPGRAGEVRAMHEELTDVNLALLEAEEVRELCPILRPGYVELGLYDAEAMNVDVHALVQGYARGLRNRGGEIVRDARVVSIAQADRGWSMVTRDGEHFVAPVVVNAAGAWADRIAELASVAPIGIRPLRRTVFMLAAPEHAGDISGLPLVAEVRDEFYFKPEGDQFLCSPADETLTEPGDPRADELAIAYALDLINETTTLNARHVRATWAGLRCFVSDRVPVVGFAPEADGFFWCAGQGGYGIQIGPALARVGAGLILSGSLPEDVVARGVRTEDLHPGRLC